MLVREYYILFCMQIRQMIKVHFKIQIGKVGVLKFLGLLNTVLL